MVTERRLAHRIDFQHEVIINRSNKLKKMLNFSTGGAFIRTEQPSAFKQGGKINLFTRLPLEKKAMVIKAEVAHVTDEGIGVKFLDLYGRDAEAIEHNFEVFKGTIPLKVA